MTGKSYSALAIFLLALALRLIHLAEIADTPYFDTLVLDAEEYDHLSDQLLRGDWLLDDMPTYVHGPLYTYVFALVKLLGFHFPAMRFIQAILGALSCVLVWRIAGHIFPHPIPLIAGFLAAGYWPFIFYNSEILATTLVLFVELVLAWFLLHVGNRLSWTTALLAGLLLALLITARSNTLLLFPLVAWWIYQQAAPATTHRRRLPWVFALSVLLCLAPFLLRNQVAQGTPLPFQGSWSLFLGTNPQADGTPYARQGLSWQRLESLPLQAGYTTPAERGRFYRAASLDFVLEHPADYLHLLYRKFRLFWHAFEIPVSTDLRYFEGHTLPSRLLILNFGVVVPLALAGMLWGRHQPAHVLLYGFILVYLATGLLFTVCARYRLPALPFLMIFAAQGIWQLGVWIRTRAFARAGGFVLLLGAATALVHTGVEQEQVDHLRSSWLQGHVYVRTQRYDLAEQAFLRRLQENPKDSDALNSLAVVYQRQGRVKEAEATFKQAVEAAPDHSRPWLNLGDLYLKQQRLIPARRALKTALRHDPRPLTQHEGYHNLGYVFLFQQASRQAYQAFKQALKTHERATTHYALATACAFLQLHEEQLDALERAVELDPTFAPAYRNLGVLYLKRGNLDKAGKAIRQAIRHDPDSPVAYRHLGALYLKQGQKDRARKAFAKALQLKGSDGGP